MLDRRMFLMGTAALTAATLPARAKSPEPASMRGSIDATELGVESGSNRDQSAAFARMLREASQRDLSVFLPGGNYLISDIELPARVRLSGVPGATRLIYGGDGAFLRAAKADLVALEGLTIDGANQWLSDRVRAILDLRNVADLAIGDCRVVNSARNGIALENVSGRVERNAISGASDAGIYSVQAKALSIMRNSVADCANGGILVHRWEAADDGTIVAGNRVERIGAINGGTGQFGNGINIFRANNVAVSNNHIANCAFSAIRSNSGSNIQISSNMCLRSGETAIYSEFAFEGASITGNIVDGAANGISVVNFNEGGRLAVCTGNLVRNLSQQGPYPADAPGFGSGIVVEADASVTGNTIEGAPLHGMRLGWGPFMRNIVASGNVIRDAGVGIAVSVVEGAGAAIISGNIIAQARNGAVLGYRWSDPVTADLAMTPDHGFPALTVENNKPI